MASSVSRAGETRPVSTPRRRPTRTVVEARTTTPSWPDTVYRRTQWTGQVDTTAHAVPRSDLTTQDRIVRRRVRGREVKMASCWKMTITATDTGQTYITSMPVTYDVVTWTFAGRTARQYVTDSLSGALSTQEDSVLVGSTR